MSKVSFDYDAGDISLDFANTVNWHASDHPIEYITDFHELLTWGEGAGILTPEAAGRLSQLALQHTEVTQQAYRSAIETREAIYRIFSNRYAQRPVSEKDLAYLNALVRESTAHRQLVPSGGHFQWEWKPDGEDVNLITWEVAFAAAELLTSDKAVWVRECEDDRGCGYLFLDLSKNHSRRWCSMESCGNRAKARRHYTRNKVENV